MARMYSRTLLAPFIGLVQIVETIRGRALTIDGRNWEIQYSPPGFPDSREVTPDGKTKLKYALIATLEHGEVKTRGIYRHLDPVVADTVIEGLHELVAAAQLPFPACDCYQYWLLDGEDETPLALVHSCTSEAEMAHCRPEPVWIPMPAVQLKVPDPGAEQSGYVPSVNYRLEKLVEERAGLKPRAAWFERSPQSDQADQADDGFPPYLINEHWETESQRQLWELYIKRLSPRLLMLQGLPRPVRRELEVAARRHVMDVARFHAVYPEVVDEQIIAAARVEARMRRSS